VIFDQKKDGSCEIIFSEEEIKIITKYKKLYLTQEFLRHFSNTLVNMTIEFNKKFDNKTKQLRTSANTKIIGNKPKD
tara:strand:- start:1360 stop:1590 length:231 start_codon:yes stop_codon:yes gene_type:complete